MIFIYRLAYFLVMKLLPFLHPISLKLSEGYKMRSKKNGKSPWLLLPKNSQPIWFHCASGEFEYALPLIRKFKTQNPEQKILVTYYTHSYAKKIINEPLVDFASPSPWDTPSVTAEFVEHFKPKALLISRTDVWPEATRTCQEQKIPTVVFSMTFNKDLSGWASVIRRMYFRWQFSWVDAFFVVSQLDQTFLKQIVPQNKITILGDTRYDQCLFRLQKKQDLKISKEHLSQKIFIAGSTWAQDEDVILPQLTSLQKSFHTIFVPHEIGAEHLTSLKEKIESAGHSVEMYSQITQWPADKKTVLIVDQLGLLADLYKLADISFVGGSFKSRVHSVMEPLACGIPVLVGPYFQNNREAIEFSQSTPPAVIPTDASQFYKKLFETAQSWSPNKKNQLVLRIQEKAKANDLVFNAIQKRL